VRGETGARPQSTPGRCRVGALVASQRERSPVGLDPRRDPRVADDLSVADGEPEDASLGLVVVVSEEVPQAEVDVGVAEPPGAEQHVGMAADDDVGARICQCLRSCPLLVRRAAPELLAQWR
jgi:hypothetical protein